MNINDLIAAKLASGDKSFKIVDQDAIKRVYDDLQVEISGTLGNVYNPTPIAANQQNNMSYSYVKKINNQFGFGIPGGSNKIVSFLNKVPASTRKFKKLHIIAQSWDDYSSYKQCLLILSKTCKATSYVGWQGDCMGGSYANKIRETWLGSYQSQYTVDYLKNQTGVIQYTPNSDHIHFSRQEIILDISTIKIDFYLAIYTCDTGLFIENIWCD